MIKDKDAKVIATVAVSRSETITDAKARAVRSANNKVETMAICKTRQLLLDRNTGSQGQSSKNVGQATKVVERILLIIQTSGLHLQLTYFRIWSESVRQIWSLMEVRCLCAGARPMTLYTVHILI